MRVAVPFRIDLGIGEPEIGREIEHAQMRRQRRDHLLRRAVRQAAEDEIELAPIDIGDGDEIGQDVAREMREDRADPLAGLAIGGQRDDRRIRMMREDAQQLGAGVAGCAQDADPRLVRARSHEPLLSSTNSNPEKERAPRRTPLRSRMRRCLRDQRFENWKLRRALALPYFLRSTTRLSRVRKPCALSAGRSPGS